MQNEDPGAAPGTECILCSDAAGANGYKGVAGCGTCSHMGSSAGSATCSACQAGAFLEGGQCTVCGVDCLVCASATECGTCTAGKYLKADKTCVDAAGCPSGTYADPANGQCKACSGITDCATCAYNATIGKPQCTSCTGKMVKTAVDGTTTCVDKAGCTTGQTHFVEGSTTKACIPCSDNTKGSILGCKTCTAKGQCSACLEGYFGSNACAPCGANCATCTQAGDDKCDTCKPGYFKQGNSPGTRTPCDDADSGIPGCAECTFSGSLACISCKPNYKQSRLDPVTCTRTCEDDSACEAH